MKTIIARAPIRICDCGGWTDTWFARHGRVFNIAVRPCAEVRIAVFPATAGRPPVVLDVADYSDRYAPSLAAGQWERHPLLEAAVASVGLPPDVSVEIAVSCGVPAGASTGTSAALTVALLGALHHLSARPIDRREVARAAHAVETTSLGRQSGIQDQILLGARRRQRHHHDGVPRCRRSSPPGRPRTAAGTRAPPVGCLPGRRAPFVRAPRAGDRAPRGPRTRLSRTRSHAGLRGRCRCRRDGRRSCRVGARDDGEYRGSATPSRRPRCVRPPTGSPG